MFFEGKDLQSEVSASPHARQIISLPGNAVCPVRELQHPTGSVLCVLQAAPASLRTRQCPATVQAQSLSLWHLHNLDKAHKHLLLPMSVPASSNLPCIPWALIHWHGSTS